MPPTEYIVLGEKMENLHKMKFRRLFSVNFYKNLKLNLGEMSFYKDFINDNRGDPYPLLGKSADCDERVAGGHYKIDVGEAERIICGHFPYATYEVTVKELEGVCGFGFVTLLGKSELLLKNENGSLSLVFDGNEIATERSFMSGMSLVVTARKNNFEVYFNYGDMPEFVAELRAEKLEGIHCEDNFKASHATLKCCGKVEASKVEVYMDAGLSQADIRPIKYENGDVIIENGKMYFTLSARMHAEFYQAIVSWVPGTCEFSLVGAIFFNTGDGAWCSDVATSLKFNRFTNKWNLWVCSFSHDHILASAEFEGDPRFGVNVIDVKLMEKGDKDSDRTAFVGFKGDEDPDFIYDEKSGKWFFTVCRLARAEDGKFKYAYHLFEGDDPFNCDRFVSRSGKGAETGGSMVYVGDKLHFVCGNDFDLRANYRVYDLPKLEEYTEMEFDYDDGGFRGWGTIVPLKIGTRTRYFHLTFDRHNASDYNWSYGNLYCFEAY